MRTFLCLSCGEVFNESVAHEDNILEIMDGGIAYTCPKINCNSPVVEVDDFLVSVIRNLNEKGFFTIACCSGHSQDSLSVLDFSPRTYILLENEIFGEEIPNYVLEELAETLPDGFELNKSFYRGNRFTIERTVDCDSESECIMAIAENCALLLDWTENELEDFMCKYFPDGEEYPLWNEEDEVEDDIEEYEDDGEDYSVSFEGEVDDEDSDFIVDKEKFFKLLDKFREQGVSD